jgi:glutathione synthase/RimK-type ligase-like ATP-grasp enzyme
MEAEVGGAARRAVAASRIAIATCADRPGLYPEGMLLIDALQERGVAAVPAVWDADVDWDEFDAVLIRTTEDYFRCPARFLDWARGLGDRVFNPAETVEWNLDKHYLAELHGRGIPVVATTYVAPGGSADFPPGQFVVKPTVSAGANSTAAYDESGHDAARRHVEKLHAAGRAVMLQPYCHLIDTEAETAVIFIDGELSHCMRKEPLLRVGQPPAESKTEDMSVCEPPADMLALARRAHDTAAASLGMPLYARVDMLRDSWGRPVLIELELIEPMLFLGYAPGSAGKLASAFIRRAGLMPGPAVPAPATGAFTLWASPTGLRTCSSRLSPAKLSSWHVARASVSALTWSKTRKASSARRSGWSPACPGGWPTGCAPSAGTAVRPEACSSAGSRSSTSRRLPPARSSRSARRWRRPGCSASSRRSSATR